MSAGSNGKIFVVDTNLFFVKRLSEALRQYGFEAVHCSEPAYALTMVEWNTPLAILCSTNTRNSGGFEIPTILRADAKTSHIPVIAIGDRGQQSQLEALRIGYEDFVDRRLGAEEIVAHLISILSSHRDGFQPTQMLGRSETALDGRLSLVDLPGVIQVLSQSRQTGGLHVNADGTDGIIFFDSGEIIHAESGPLVGDQAIIQLVKSCYLAEDGVYKFIPGDAVALRTVQANLSALILDALRELDEQGRETPRQAGAEAIPEPDGQQSDPVAGEDSSPVVEEPLASSPTDPDLENGSWASTEAEAPPVTKTQTEVCTARQESTEEYVACEVAGQESNPATKNGSLPSLDERANKSVFDEDAWRELNELLSGLSVEDEGSHE
jgi:DNA-binding response OmpR family regulator